jgi:ribosomal protein L30/L7E
MLIELKQLRSAIGCTQRQKDNLISLRLGRIGDISIIDDANSSLAGRLRKIRHLVFLRPIEDESKTKKVKNDITK